MAKQRCWSRCFFAIYVFLYIDQGLLIKLSGDQQDEHGGYHYDTKAAVLATELLKLCFAFGLYFRYREQPGCRIWHWFADLYRNRQLGLLYLVPSLLYCIYNNLTYLNLRHYDPTTYYTLLQFRTVLTGLLFQLFFGRHLSRLQWISLAMLTTGCIVKQWDRPIQTATVPTTTTTTTTTVVNVHFLALVLVQIFCSCLAGVYNEYLLKGQATKAPLMIHNAYMYLTSIVCNVAVVLLLPEEPANANRFILLLRHMSTILVVANGALCGLATSLFLVTFDSIAKAYASGLELILSAILSAGFFRTAISVPITGTAILLVSIAIYLYAK